MLHRTTVRRAFRPGAVAAVVVAALIAVVVALLPWATAAAPAAPPCEGDLYADVPADNPFCGEIKALVDDGFMSADENDLFRPAEVITRAAFAEAGYPGSLEACEEPPFPDVPVDHEACPAIQAIKKEGLAAGYPDGTFRPDNPVTRQVAAAVIARAATQGTGQTPPACESAPFPDVSADDEFCAAIQWFVGAGIAQGYTDGMFHPTSKVTRQSLAAIIYRFIVWSSDQEQGTSSPSPVPNREGVPAPQWGVPQG